MEVEIEGRDDPDRVIRILERRFRALGIPAVRVARIAPERCQEPCGQVAVELGAMPEGDASRVKRALRRRGVIVIRRCDDQVDPIGTLLGAAPDEVPEGIEIHVELAGREGTRVHYAAASDRNLLADWLPRVPLSPGHRFGIAPGPDHARSYLLHEAIEIDNGAVADARAERSDSRWAIALALTEAGAERFLDLTTRSVGQRIAIQLDEDVMSVPLVLEPIASSPVYLTLGEEAGEAEAIELAAVLSSGSLPALTVLREEIVEVGQDEEATP